MDIFHKAPDTRKARWWRIPIPTKEYKDNYDQIFNKGKKETGNGRQKRVRRTTRFKV